MDKNLPSGLSCRDVAELSWYFGIGHATFERSVQGAILENAWLFAVPRGKLTDLSAKPRQNSQSSNPADHAREGPDEQTMLRYGGIARRLGKLSHRDWTVLAEVYGDAGAVAIQAKQPRVGVLLAASEKGQKLLIAERDLEPTEPAHFRILTRRVLQKRPPGLAGALRECEALLSRAESAYGRTGS